MQPFRPLSPLVLAFAQALQQLSHDDPRLTLEDAVRKMLEDRPSLHAADAQPMASQLNDLMHLADPGPDDVRIAMMLFLPVRRGCLFTMQNLPVAEIQQFRTSPLPQIGGALAASLDANWPEVLKVVDTIPVPLPLRLVGADGLPAEAHHAAAAGPQPGNLQQFLRP